MNLTETVCGGVLCYDPSSFCCKDKSGLQICCSQPFYQEAWFWSLLATGILLVVAVTFCICRFFHRYHNAIHYTRLRKQSQHCGTIPRVVTDGDIPPPPLVGGTAQCGYGTQLPSYSSVIGAPPAYSER